MQCQEHIFHSGIYVCVGMRGCSCSLLATLLSVFTLYIGMPIRWLRIRGDWLSLTTSAVSALLRTKTLFHYYVICFSVRQKPLKKCRRKQCHLPDSSVTIKMIWRSRFRDPVFSPSLFLQCLGGFPFSVVWFQDVARLLRSVEPKW